MNRQNNQLSEISYNSFVSYFEISYIKVLGTLQVYEERYEFLKLACDIAESHKRTFELRHGRGSYIANLAKYGSMKRTPLQIIYGDLNVTNLLKPKLSNSYYSTFGIRNFERRGKAFRTISNRVW